MKSDNDLINEGEKTNLNGLNVLKKFVKEPISSIKTILFYLFIIICFLFLSLRKTNNPTIESFESLNYQNILSQNQKIIEYLNFIEIKLQILELNQKIISNQEKIISNNNNNIYNLLSSMEVLDYKKFRIGNNSDGGYILLNDLKNIKITYSFGIGNEISFEKQLADKNIDVFMYDHTINKLPFENSKFHWKKIGVCGKNIIENNTKLLSELIKENGHLKEENMILKLDIEGYEWDVFQDLPYNILRKFKYIVGEFHFNNSNDHQYYNILKYIQVTHQIFHVHCNNCGEIIDFNGLKICNLLEISFIQKEGYNFTKDNNIYPIEGLDYKNCKDKGDLSYIINLFNKYSNN